MGVLKLLIIMWQLKAEGVVKAYLEIDDLISKGGMEQARLYTKIGH
jgi:hypothetical protein